MMQRFSLFLFAFALGFVAAVPIGPCQIEVAKRAIKGHLRAALMVACGSASSDIVYGGVALYGIAPFLEIPGVAATFNAVSALILWVLSYLTWKDSRAPQEVHLDRPALNRKRWAYLTGFSLSLSNPPIILSWIIGVALAKRFGLASPFPDTAKLIFIAGGVLGLGSYLAGFGLLVHRIKHFIPLQAIGRIYRWLAVVLFALSWFFLYGTAKYFLAGAGRP